MKTLFILIPDALATKNYLRSQFWVELQKKHELRTIILCSAEKADEYRKEFGNDRVLVEVVDSVAHGRWEGVISFIARNALRTGHMRIHQMRNYIDFGGLPMLLLKSFLWLVLGRSSLLHRLIRKLDLHIPPAPRVKELFDTYTPNLVFSSSILNGSLDVAFLREAQRRGIHTIGIPRGWDNYTSKGILRVIPDTLLAMDTYLVEMGREYQSLHKETRVVGFPGMDQYVDRRLIQPRESFLSSIGVDPTKRMILFCALGDYSVPSEWEIAEAFNTLVATGKLPSDLVMVYRAHPSFESHTEELARLPHVVHNRKAEYKEGDVSTWEMGKSDIAYYMNSIAHSEMVITTGSTAGIDAIAMNKPVISAAFENRPINYWLSARRFRKHFTHYIHLVETGGVATADSPAEMALRITEYLENPQKDAEGRAHAKARFLSPLDGGAGGRIAKEVLALL
jgi:hypothetical protein